MSDTESSMKPTSDSRAQQDAGQEEWFRPAPPRERPEAASIDDTAPVEYTVTMPVGLTPVAEPKPGFRQRATTFAGTLVRNWPAAVVLALFATAAMIVPTMTNIATTDDWAYSRSVEILVNEGVLKVFPVVAATAVGQILWGALFALIFGMSLGVMRLSTVVMAALGAAALYAILRMLGVSRSRSAVGTAVWLFNPLTFSLAFSFMTDAHFVSVMLISLAFYVKGVRPGREDIPAIVTGSFFAGFAFLIRQQGALIPFAVGVYLLMTGRLWFRWPSVKRLAAVALLPAIMLIGYYVWLRWFNDAPDVQQHFFAEISEKGWAGTWLLIQRIPVYVLFYAGALLAPVLIAIFPRRKSSGTFALFASPLTFYAFGIWSALVTLGLYLAGRRGHEMPFASQFWGAGALGPPDVVGGGHRLYGRGTEIPIALTVVAAVGAILLGLVICRRLISERTPERAGFWLVVMVAIWQLVGIFPPSYHYTNRGATLDRYLLPVLALVIITAMWALRDVNLFQPVAWLLLAAVAVFSVAGTRVYLVFMGAVWDMADYANANGVADDRLDAGSGWDGYHLYTRMLDENITKARSPKGSPWWIYFYAKPTDSSYIVATDPSALRGYTRVESQEYNQWLENDPVYVYLMKRWYLPFPPTQSTPDGKAPSPAPGAGPSAPDPAPTAISEPVTPD